MTLPERLSETSGRSVSRETARRVGQYFDALLDENQRQNLISPKSVRDALERHIIDSAQLLRFDEQQDSHWVDVGTGPGLPGVVIALLHEGRVSLIEPRKLRVAFLEKTVSDLALSHRVEVIHGKAARFQGKCDVITGRAVASLPSFFHLTIHMATKKTRWILPKGRKAQEELEEARSLWQGEFSLAPSLTDPEASIVLASAVHRRGKA